MCHISFRRELTSKYNGIWTVEPIQTAYNCNPNLEYHNDIALLIGSLLYVEDPDFVENWIRCFAALLRTNKIQNNKINAGENEIADLFLATTGFEVIRKISLLTYPTEIEEMTLTKLKRLFYGIFNQGKIGHCRVKKKTPFSLKQEC